MVCWTGPTCMPIRSSSLSLLYGVAVSPELPPCADLLDRVLENAAAGTWWHSSATISPYPAVSSAMSSRRDRVCSVMRSMEPRSFALAAAELPGLDAEELADPGSPLVGQCFAVDQDKRGDLMSGDHRRTPSRSSPTPGGGDQHTEVMLREFRDRILLNGASASRCR